MLLQDYDIYASAYTKLDNQEHYITIAHNYVILLLIGVCIISIVSYTEILFKLFD